MEAKYDIYESPGTDSEGQKKKIHARVITNETIDSDEIARKIEFSSSLTISDVNAVLTSLSHYVCNLLGRGKRVHIRGLGYFQMTLKCEINNSEQKVRNESVHFKSVSFRPENSLRKELKEVKFIRTQRKTHSVRLTNKSIHTLLLKYFETHDYITRAEFQQLCGFTQITAIRRINQLIMEGKLRKKGVKMHPIYVPVYEKLNNL